MKEWAPHLRNLIESTKDDPRGITLLGDAAHLVTPFAGIGVNTAFYDAMQLLKQLTAFAKSKGPAGLDSYIMHYEKAMIEQAHPAQVLTEGSKTDMLLTPGAPRITIKSWIPRRAYGGTPAWTHPIMTAVVYAGYWVYKWFV